jgi:hypothetical protein
MSVDSRGHNGQKSLRIVFNAPRSLEKIPLSQTVVVEPGVQYRFEVYMRTEELISANVPNLFIVDTIDGVPLGGFALTSGTSDWQRVTFDFTTKPDHDAVTLMLTRTPCADGQICPIFGKLWYDDFNLQRLSAPGSKRKDAGSPRR